MSFRVSGKNIEIGAALQDHARNKMSAIIGKYFETEVSGHVTLEPEGSGFRADMFVHLTNGVTVQAEGRAHEAYACFDQAAERVDKRLRRHKRRLKDRHSGPGLADRPDQQLLGTMASYVIETPTDDDVSADFSPVVVAETKTPLKHLSVSAAVLELDMSGAPLLVFRHSTSAQVNIVYRRTDGHIGWIDPSSATNGAADPA